MGLTLEFSLSQSADCTKLNLTDNTGAYSSGNPNGWGAPNADLIDVISVYVAGTFRPYPCNAPAVNIPSTELMPSPNSLPYSLYQEFILNPSMLGFLSTSFQDGIYTLGVTVNTSLYTITDSGSDFVAANWQVGDHVLDVTTGKYIGYIKSVTTNTVVLYQPSGFIVSISDHLATIHGALVLTAAMTTSFNNNAYPATIQQIITCNADCCLSNKLAKIDWASCCDCKEIDEACDGIFMPIMGAKAMAGASQNNSALDTLAKVAANCSGCGCGCS